MLSGLRPHPVHECTSLSLSAPRLSSGSQVAATSRLWVSSQGKRKRTGKPQTSHLHTLLMISVDMYREGDGRETHQFPVSCGFVAASCPPLSLRPSRPSLRASPALAPASPPSRPFSLGLVLLPQPGPSRCLHTCGPTQEALPVSRGEGHPSTAPPASPASKQLRQSFL